MLQIKKPTESKYKKKYMGSKTEKEEIYGKIHLIESQFSGEFDHVFLAIGIRDYHHCIFKESSSSTMVSAVCIKERSSA